MADSPPTLPTRLPLVDVLRGVAIAAMVIYHFSWDLAYHGFVDWDVAGAPAWRGFAMAIAGSFLFLVGVSLALAGRDGVDGRKAARRIAKIALAAGLVSLVTLQVFGAGWIYFGILHMIAVGSLLALPVARAHPAVAFAGAAIVLGVWAAFRDSLPDWPVLWPLGLSADPAPANDYVPVFPWLAAVLAGVGLGRMIVAGWIRLPEVTATAGASRWLATAGRWSLVIYLVHQPVLFGLVGQVAAFAPANERVERARFVGSFEA